MCYLQAFNKILIVMYFFLDDDRGLIFNNRNCCSLFVEQNKTMVVSHYRMGFVLNLKWFFLNLLVLIILLFII